MYAADQGVDIINMSLGGSLVKSGEAGFYTAREAAELKNFIAEAVRYAYQRGVTVIVSAGNDAINGDKDRNLIHLPSDAPHAISISATAPVGWATAPNTTFLDNPASYTNYGRSVINLAAPGGDASYPGNENCLIGGLVRPCWVFDMVFSTGGVVGPNAFYYWSAGTSMAAPHAAGVAALIVGRYGRLHPATLRSLLERGADDLGQPGNDPFYGAGRCERPELRAVRPSALAIRKGPAGPFRLSRIPPLLRFRRFQPWQGIRSGPISSTARAGRMRSAARSGRG